MSYPWFGKQQFEQEVGGVIVYWCVCWGKAQCKIGVVVPSVSRRVNFHGVGFVVGAWVGIRMSSFRSDGFLTAKHPNKLNPRNPAESARCSREALDRLEGAVSSAE